jgi:(2Fe-2S) ferredoxin
MGRLTKQGLVELKEKVSQQPAQWIKVGMSTCGIAAGADEVYKTLAEEARKKNIQIEIKKCGCLGMCYAEPLVEVHSEGLPQVIYGRVDKDVAVKILEEHVLAKRFVNDHIFDLPLQGF